MGLYEDAIASRPAVMERVEVELVSGKNFLNAEMSHRSRRGFMGPLTAREYGTIMARMGDMAQRSSKLAFLASQVIRSVNLYGDRAQACAAIFEAIRATVAEDFYDVYLATAPDGGRRSAHMHAWTLADKIIARGWANVLTAGLTASVPGHGWALEALAEREGIILPKIP